MMLLTLILLIKLCRAYPVIDNEIAPPLETVKSGDFYQTVTHDSISLETGAISQGSVSETEEMFLISEETHIIENLEVTSPLVGKEHLTIEIDSGTVTPIEPEEKSIKEAAVTDQSKFVGDETVLVPSVADKSTEQEIIVSKIAEYEGSSEDVEKTSIPTVLGDETVEATSSLGEGDILSESVSGSILTNAPIELAEPIGLVTSSEDEKETITEYESSSEDVEKTSIPTVLGDETVEATSSLGEEDILSESVSGSILTNAPIELAELIGLVTSSEDEKVTIRNDILCTSSPNPFVANTEAALTEFIKLETSSEAESDVTTILVTEKEIFSVPSIVDEEVTSSEIDSESHTTDIRTVFTELTKLDTPPEAENEINTLLSTRHEVVEETFPIIGKELVTETVSNSSTTSVATELLEVTKLENSVIFPKTEVENNITKLKGGESPEVIEHFYVVEISKYRNGEIVYSPEFSERELDQTTKVDGTSNKENVLLEIEVEGDSLTNKNAASDHLVEVTSTQKNNLGDDISDDKMTEAIAEAEVTKEEITDVQEEVYPISKARLLNLHILHSTLTKANQQLRFVQDEFDSELNNFLAIIKPSPVNE